MPVMFFIRVSASGQITRLSQPLMDEIKPGAIPARISPGPNVGLIGAGENVISGTGDFIVIVSLPAEVIRVGPFALMRARVRSDLVPVCDGQSHPRPDRRYRLFASADKDSRFDS